MGWRYRKSINLGGGFRINLSKSGIGYSWGFPGYRHTYSANGSQRKTYSIPGTGISYVESKRKNNNYNHKKNNFEEINPQLITGGTTYYRNEHISSMGKNDEILKQINKLRIIDLVANICLIVVVLFPIGFLLKFLIQTKWKIDLSYEMDEINQKKFNALNEFLVELKNNKKLWQIESSVKVYNTKYNAGANNNISRYKAVLIKKMPWYITHNIDVYCLVLRNEKIFFTPDRMIIFKTLGGVGCRKYNDMVAGFSTVNFVESQMVPRDAEIVTYTWKYVNKNGGPDKRFNNNRRFPVCKYGEISLESEDGINILLECSNYKLMYSIQDKFTKFMNYHNTIISSKGYSEKYYLNDDSDIQDSDTLKDESDFEKINQEMSNVKNTILEVKDEDILVEKQEKSHEEDKPKSISLESFFTFLCYMQVVCAIILILSCIMNKMIYGTIMWLLVILAFLPKVKEIITKKNAFIRKHIIIIRIILVVLAVLSFSTLTYQFEGIWNTEDGKQITIDSTYVINNSKSNKKLNYSSDILNVSGFDYVYEIDVKNEENEKLILRYYKNNLEEFICVYENNKCVERYIRNK